MDERHKYGVVYIILMLSMKNRLVFVWRLINGKYFHKCITWRVYVVSSRSSRAAIKQAKWNSSTMSLLIYRGHIGSERNQQRRTPCHITSANYNHVGPPSLLFPRSSVSIRGSYALLCYAVPLPVATPWNLLTRDSPNLYVTHLQNETLLCVCLAIFS